MMLTEEIAKSFLKDNNVDLSKFGILEDGAAKVLANSRWPWLALGGLTSISEAAALALAKGNKNQLDLSGLTSLSDTAAEAFSNSKWYNLTLNGLTSLSETTAQVLANYKGFSLSLSGLTSISELVAQRLAKCESSLDLSGIESLSDEVAKALAEHTGGIDLSGLTSISDGAANALSKHEGDINLSGLTTISDASAQSLSKCEGEIGLSGLTTISDASAKALSKRKGYLNLWGVTFLSDPAAKALANFKGRLDLSGLTSLSEAAAQALAKHKGELELSKDIQRILSAVKNRQGHGKLVEARATGVTLLRTFWEGHGDDGFFQHQFLKKTKPFNPVFKSGSQENKFQSSITTDVEEILTANDCSWIGEQDGSVGLLEIDLLSGQATWWEASFSSEHARLAEFLQRCEWVNANSVASVIKFSDDDDSSNEEVTSVTSSPATAKKKIQSELQTLISRLNSFESYDDEETLTQKVRRQCGASVSLTVDVARRTFVFTGNGKKVSLKVPKNELEIKRFKVELGGVPGGQTKPSKRSKK